DSVSLTGPRCSRRAPHDASRANGACRHGPSGMLPNLRFIAASLVASIAIMTFGFGLFAAFRIANQSSVVFARPGEFPAPQVFAQSPEEAPAAAPPAEVTPEPAQAAAEVAAPAVADVAPPATQAAASAEPEVTPIAPAPPVRAAEEAPATDAPVSATPPAPPP